MKDMTEMKPASQLIQETLGMVNGDTEANEENVAQVMNLEQNFLKTM